MEHLQTYLSKQEAAHYLRRSPRFIDYVRQKGELNGYFVGRRLLFKRSDLDSFVEQCRSDFDAPVPEVHAEESSPTE